MSETISEPRGQAESRPIPITPALCLLVVAALACVVFRARCVGHLLLWDETMALCTARSFVSGGNDFFSLWFWRHPPLFSLLTLTLSPLSPGFAERVEWMTVGIACLNLLLLFRLNAGLWGTVPAAWSAFLLATMPGAIFFDTWIKTDHTVTTFGLLALLALRRDRVAYAGLCLGLGLLSKENAVFYGAAAGLVFGWATWRQRGCLLRLGLLVLVPAITVAWWYLLFAGRLGEAIKPSLSGLLDHAAYAVGGGSAWASSWSYYVSQLPDLVGWPGLGLVLAGAVTLVVTLITGFARASNPRPSQNRLAAWPLALVLVSYVPLSLLPSKVPWLVISILPAFATLGALGLCGLWNLAAGRLRPARRTAIVLSSAAILATLAMTWWRQDYDGLLRRIVPDQHRGAMRSRQIAEQMNALAQPGDRVLLTSFHYWAGLPPGQPCAVFTYYFSKGRDVSILLRPHTAPAQGLVEDLSEYQIDWAVLSPPPGELETEVRQRFKSGHALPEIQSEGAWIYDTRGFRERDRGSGGKRP